MSNKIKKYGPWFIWGLSALFYFYEYFLQVSVGVMVPELMHDFAVNATVLGNLAAFYFYAYASMQIPVGILLDRYGVRYLLTLATSICMLGCFLFGFAHTLLLAKTGRFFIGLGSAFAAIGCLKLAANWFSGRRFALLTGIMVAVGTLGAIGGQTPLALLVRHIGWRSSLILLGIIGGVISVAIWRIVRDKPEVVAEKSVSTHFQQVGLLQGLQIVLGKKQSWLVAVYGGLMFAPTSIFGSLWGVPFLVEKYNLDRPTAAAVISVMFVGWALGSVLFGWISDHIGRRRPPMIVGSIGALITILGILYLPNLSLLAIDILLFAFGIFSSGFLPSFSIMREINPHYVSATALGFMNMLNMVGGAIGQPLVGWMLDLTWQGKMQEGVRIYSAAGFHVALAILPLLIALSLVVLFFVCETYGGNSKLSH